MTNTTYVYTAIQSIEGEETVIGIYATVEGAKAACEEHDAAELEGFDPAPLEWQQRGQNFLAEVESCYDAVEYTVEKHVLGA